jgi:FkbM family methyltransferase
MVRSLRIIAADFRGLCRVCGVGVAVRWLFAIAANFSACRVRNDLQPADAAVGDGPFRVRFGKFQGMLGGRSCLTGIREIWVRDPYLDGYLTIGPSAVVLDLGSNMGVFTALALAHGPGVRVFAVEADPAECDRLRRTIADNRAEKRCTVINAFVGGTMNFQDDLKARDRAATVPTLSPAQLLSQIGAPPDFIKCDIEGSEFALLNDPQPIFASAQQVSMELHPDQGNADAAIQRLRELGFEVKVLSRPPTLMALCRRK